MTSKNTVLRRDYVADGIRVEQYSPLPTAALKKGTPLICVHGGCQASWCWADHAPAYAEAGYEVHALNWLGRNGSDAIDEERFVTMSIADVVDDIAKVARGFDTPPVLVAHSMGALAAQLYAERHPVRALALLTPVVPSNVGAEPVELPLGDPTVPWQPPPLELARQLFFQGSSAAQSEQLHALLVPESPRRVLEASRFTMPVDAAKIGGPVLVVSGALDVLTPPALGRKLADLYGAHYRLEPGHGHNVLAGPDAVRIAQDIVAWLQSQEVV